MKLLVEIILEKGSKEDKSDMVKGFMGFEYREVFIKSLQPFLTPDEAHMLYVVDRDLRLEEFSPRFPVKPIELE